ncbi:MAG TPA: carboxypeptidase M32 [Lacipirellulaceae bacterium]
MQATFEQLCAHTRDTVLLSSTQSLLEWDERTKLPPAGGTYRAEQVSFLAGLVHKRQTQPEIGGWLADLAGSALAQDPHSDTGAVICNLQRDYDKATKLPQSLVEELARTAVLGQQVWAEARAANDFDRFRPLLERTVELKRQEADALGYADVRYDALLDEYEPGAKTAEVRQVLAMLRGTLVPLVAEIAASSRRPKSEILKRHFSVEQQKTFGRQAAEAIGFDFQSGRIDVTDHPFCTELGPSDTRLTTRYNDHDFCDGLFTTLHEAGHGIYDQGLPKEHYGLPTGEAVSLGVHESQSRMWENLVGRSLGFWEHFYPLAQRVFRESLADVPLEDFYFAINDVRPSLIRTEADEVTYNLHVLVRFELEQALLDDDLRVADLPGAWNEKYRKYLGIEPPADTDGVLQDVHWSAGLFGYFPTYSLGNLYASQLFEQAQQELGELELAFRNGQFRPLRDWLQAKVHREGRRYPAAQLVQRISGQAISPSALMRHLRGKFSPLYGLR